MSNTLNGAGARFLAAAFAAIMTGVFAPGAYAQNFYTGDGGRAIRLAVLAPEGKALGGDDWMPAYIQGILNANFGKYSAITVVDRQDMDKILAEQQLSETGYYAETDYAKIGNVTNANHILAGQILKISASQYSLQLAVSHAETGERKASFTANTTPDKLRDAAVLNQATADLLAQLGVSLTEAAKTALGNAQSEQAVNAQANLAKGIEAMRKGTVVEALSYFIQSSNIDPSLAEAASRVNITSSNISSGNIGADARNAIAWRKAWVDRLAECDQFVADYYANPLPTNLVYSTGLKQGKIDWEKETLPIGFDIALRPDQNWLAPVTGVVNAVYKGLKETGQARTWKIRWPDASASGGPSQVEREVTVKYNVTVQLLNDQGAVIGTQTVPLSAGLSTYFFHETVVRRDSKTVTTVIFPAMDANNITDKMTIKVVSLDGKSAEAAARAKKVSISDTAGFAKMKTGKVYKTGDTGPVGGIMLVTMLHVLEVAPANTEFRASWDEAMSKCSTLQIGGTSGWRLPTKDELRTMYLELKRKGLGGFSTSWYWSSSGSDVKRAWSQSFDIDLPNTHFKSIAFPVRAVREF